jgi:hypothetical protein
MTKQESETINDETYDGEEQILYDICKELRAGFIYYDEKEDRILQLTKSKVYFRPQVFWKMVTTVNGRNRTITSMSECKEMMNKSGYEYLGEL